MKPTQTNLRIFYSKIFLLCTIFVFSFGANAFGKNLLNLKSRSSDSSFFRKPHIGFGISFFDFVQGQVTLVGKYKRHELNLGMTISPKIHFVPVREYSECPLGNGCPIIYYSYYFSLSGTYTIVGSSISYYIQLNPKSPRPFRAILFVEYSEYNKYFTSAIHEEWQYKERFQTMAGVNKEILLSDKLFLNFTLMFGGRYFYDRTIGIVLIKPSNFDDFLSTHSVLLPRINVKLDFNYILNND